ncbi:MAG: hypothetical protein ACRDCA_13355 [Serratia sp. (in: enterobacteria)]|uniref:hypothetical protein n=1 Tax=Serratia sp. (in: enterobacteria) TaxID=616 RepID=UPI003F39C560
MNIIKGKMLSDSGVKIKLSDLLEKIPDNEWIWCVYEFNGVGIAPLGLSMPEFEELVLSKDTGLELTWKDIKSLAESLTDIMLCTLGAITHPVPYSCIENNELDNFIVLVRIFDSTSWEINMHY